jgi:ketol-acid reductoisomerase
LDAELKELRESELWQAGQTVRSLRPENQNPVQNNEVKKSKSK